MNVETLASLIKNLTQQFINREFSGEREDKDIFWVLVLDTHQDLEEMGINTDPVAHILAKWRRSPENQTIQALFSELPKGHPIYLALIGEAAEFVANL